jgi:hypothetical protein
MQSQQTKADPPFDFAQGRLSGDDNEKGRGDGISRFAAAYGMGFIGGCEDERGGR